MSIKISRLSLTDEIVNQIRNDLRIESVSGFPGSPFYNVSMFDFYHYIAPTKELYVPRWYGRRLNVEGCSDRKYETCRWTSSCKFFDHQIPVIKESLEILDNEGGIILALYPSWGKTLAGVYLAQNRGLVTLVVSPITAVIPSWQQSFKEFSNAKVCTITDIEKIDPHADVYIAMDSRVELLPPNISERIGTLILDEGHKLCTPSRVRSLLATQPKYIIIETGTPVRPDGAEKMLFQMVGNNIIYRSMPKTIEFYKIKLNHVKIPDVKQRFSNGKVNLDYNDLINKVSDNEDYNKELLNLIKNNLHYKILVLVARKAHAVYLHNCLTEMGISSAYMIGGVKNYKDCNCLIGTLQRIGTGWDQSKAALDFDGVKINLLIWCTSTKQQTVLEQGFGRVYRADNPTIFYLLPNHPTFENHYKIAKRYLKTLNCNIHE